MLFLALFSCKQEVVTYVGGGSATVTLSGLEGWNDSSFDVPGLSEDQLDDLFSDGHHPDEVQNRLDGDWEDEDWVGTVLTRDPEDGGVALEIEDNVLSGFTPCGLSLTHSNITVGLRDQSVGLLISDWPFTSKQVVSPALPESGVHVVVHDWNVEDYAGSFSVDVDVTCPEATQMGRLTVEWAMDPDVTRDAHGPEKKQPKGDGGFCIICY